jgi:uncharacterized protein YjbI with pentapeptide repeats
MVSWNHCAPQDRLVIYAAQNAMPGIDHVATYDLAGWDRDDLVEYLLAVHAKQCAAVMSRLSPIDYRLFQGVPELWRLVLDRLAADDSLPDGRTAFHSYLQDLLADTDLIERARSACLTAVCTPGTAPAGLETLARPGFAAELMRILRHPAAHLMLAAERIASDLHGDADCDFLAHQLPKNLVLAAAGLIREDASALDHLRTLLAGPCWSHAMSASLLHAARIGWVPGGEPSPVLARAYLSAAVWPCVQLTGADLTETDLSSADLACVNLSNAVAIGANFRGTNFTGAVLVGLGGDHAEFTAAKLNEVYAERAFFASANLEGAYLERADLRNASFTDANLTRASFFGSNLTKACFLGARIEGARFCDVDLSEAELSGLSFHEALGGECRFTRTQLDKCDLEGTFLYKADFEGANLEGTLLTATWMPEANFRNANLRDTGLADVEWEGADLRGADLTGASFHLGSTRSGLVGSPISCEGSRTGFYTDEYEEQRFKEPEEIRKANLCGADLRGARIDAVDFYLVDLRGALLDPEQEEHVRRCRAILETPVC